MSTSTLPVLMTPVPSLAAAEALPVPRSPWLVNRWFDLFLFANCTWPLYALLAGFGIQAITESVSFWQIYLLATPHRWITLSLVFLDRERFAQRRLAYLGIMLSFLIVIVACVRLEAIALLVAIDWVWNTWHFAAQHSGISRIYNRVAHPEDKGNGMLEKVVLRTFLVYTLLRLAGGAIDSPERERWMGWLDWAIPYVKVLDFPMLVLPAFLLARELFHFTRPALGRLIYLTSVCVLYSCVLVGLSFQAPGSGFSVYLGGAVVAITIFHSTEYLAIVSWSVKKRHAKSTTGVFARLLPYWGIAIVTFMVTMAVTASLMQNYYSYEWALITIFVSWLHYAYDGMIWKVRRPASASVAIS